MQAWNLGQPAEKRIRFVGMDVQNPYLGVQALIRVGHTEPLLELLTEIGRLEAGNPEAQALMAALEGIEVIETDRLRRSYARNARRFVDTYLLEPAHKRLGLRDGYMAQTLLEEGLDDSGLTVFWAHNEHVAVNPDFAGDAASGFALRESLGPAFLSVGMLLGQGHFRVRDLDAPGQPKPLAELPVDLPQPHHSDAQFLNQPAGLYAVQDYPHAGPRRFLGGHYGTLASQANPQRFEMPRPLDDFHLLRWFPAASAATGLPEQPSS